MVQFYPWFEFYFPLFLVMVMYDEFETKENINQTKKKIEPQYIHSKYVDNANNLYVYIQDETLQIHQQSPSQYRNLS